MDAANEPAYMAERRDGNGKVMNRGCKWAFCF